MTNANAWFALGGALGGVTLTGAMGLWPASLTHRWSLSSQREEESRVIRDQRRETCHNYLLAVNSLFQAIDQLHLILIRGEEVDPDERIRPAILAQQDAYVYLTISCGADVRELAHQYNGKLYDLLRTAQQSDINAWNEKYRESYEARRRLREAMRAELGVLD
jgi:hypothetical protein